MTSLYNLHTDGDNWRITKFNSEGEPESSYLVDHETCQCPAGERPTCRHRTMLPLFLHRGFVNDFHFYDYDRGGWVTNGPAPQALSSKPEIESGSALYTDLGDVRDKIMPLPEIAPVLSAKPSWRRI